MTGQSDHKAEKPVADELPPEEAERVARDVARRLLTTLKRRSGPPSATGTETPQSVQRKMPSQPVD